MKPDKLLLELEQLLEQCGYQLRKERGSFRGNDCIIEGEKLVIINRGRPAESQLGTLARILYTVNMEGVYIKPAVRKELENLWDRLAISGKQLEFED